MTMHDDDLVWTHDGALSVLRYAVPGARIATIALREPLARRYVVTLERVGHREISQGDVYALPIEASELASRARQLADAAVAAAEV
jgi:hypothetical protein